MSVKKTVLPLAVRQAPCRNRLRTDDLLLSLDKEQTACEKQTLKNCATEKISYLAKLPQEVS